MLLGVLNGVIDLNTGEFREGRREDYITKQCGVAFDPNATCPNWEAFQTKIADDDKELISYKRRFFGVLLTGLLIEILFILHGGGNNGKPTEMETVSEMLGDYAHAADASLLIAAHKRKDGEAATPGIVALKGKRAVFINKTSENDQLNEARVKYLTGNDTMSGRDLFESVINFKPTHKPVLRTNHRPTIRGTDLGIWRRIHYIPYNVTIADDEDVKDFRETVLMPELAGILNWALAGLREFLANGRKLKPPLVVQKATKEYRAEMNTAGQWIDLVCSHVKEKPDEARYTLTELYTKYEVWCTVVPPVVLE